MNTIFWLEVIIHSKNKKMAIARIMLQNITTTSLQIRSLPSNTGNIIYFWENTIESEVSIHAQTPLFETTVGTFKSTC